MTIEKAKLEDVPEVLFGMQEKIDTILLLVLELVAQDKREQVENVFLSVREAALLTGYAQQSIRTKVMQGTIPSFKLEGKRMFNKEDLLDWINKTRRY